MSAASLRVLRLVFFFFTGVFPDGDMPVSDQVFVDLEAGESVLENDLLLTFSKNAKLKCFP